MRQGVSEEEHNTCFDCWNEHEVADAVKVMKEVRFDGEDTAGASPRPTRGEVTDA